MTKWCRSRAWLKKRRMKARSRLFRSGWLLAAGALLACTVHPEETILDRFFQASRLRDRTALGELATIILEPLDQGIVTTFEIRDVARDGSGRKTVTVDAPVKLPDGQVVQKTLHLTMELRDGRWMVTGLQM